MLGKQFDFLKTLLTCVPRSPKTFKYNIFWLVVQFLRFLVTRSTKVTPSFMYQARSLPSNC